jgi:hypothetical protein
MFTDKLGNFRARQVGAGGCSKTVKSGYRCGSTEIVGYAKPPYGLSRFTDDIAPYRGKSLSSLDWLKMFAAIVAISAMFVVVLTILGRA